MAPATTINAADLSEIAHRAAILPMELMEQAVNDGIITGVSDFNGAGQQAPEYLHLAGSVADFETYVRRLAVSSR
ncbi:hypothetical protein ACERIT_08735 [Halopenitus sp. H-Gu1]|uniref:hypothetical protein n=1 Tax=Halopenitus sp. H-Gu1 TaxID=3242697 RepID=UPI00359D60A3